MKTKSHSADVPELVGGLYEYPWGEDCEYVGHLLITAIHCIDPDGRSVCSWVWFVGDDTGTVHHVAIDPEMKRIA